MKTKYNNTVDVIDNGLALLDDVESPVGFRIHRNRNGALNIGTVRKSWNKDYEGMKFGGFPVSDAVLDGMIEALESLRSPLKKALKKASKEDKEKKASKGKQSKGKGDVKRRREGKTETVDLEREFELALEAIDGRSRISLERVLTQPHCKVVAKKQYKAFRTMQKTGRAVPMAELKALVRKVQSKVS